MTEKEWLVCKDPLNMLQFIKQRRTMRRQAKQRKQRLFSVACCRRIWPLITNERSRHGVEVVERFADGLAMSDELQAAEAEADAIWRKNASLDIEWACMKLFANVVDGMHVSIATVRAVFKHEQAAADKPVDPQEGHDLEASPAEEREQCRLLRDIFGNPFRRVTFSPAWLTSTVTALARQMYESRDFSAMPILADALQDAGCGDEQVLSHCREPGVHVRGCFVVDSCLANE